MKTITKEWVCGNVAVKVSFALAGVSDGLGKLIAEGVVQVCQGKPSSAWEKEHGWQGADKRPEKFQRSSIAYSDAGAADLRSRFEEALHGMLGGSESVAFRFEVSEHVRTADAGFEKRVAELWSGVQSYPKDRFVKAMAQLGLDVEDYDDEKGLAACRAFLRKPSLGV